MVKKRTNDDDGDRLVDGQVSTILWRKRIFSLLQAWQRISEPLCSGQAGMQHESPLVLASRSSHLVSKWCRSDKDSPDMILMMMMIQKEYHYCCLDSAITFPRQEQSIMRRLLHGSLAPCSFGPEKPLCTTCPFSLGWTFLRRSFCTKSSK